MFSLPAYTGPLFELNWLTTALITGQSLGGLLVALVSTQIGNLERMLSGSLAIVIGFISERIAFPKVVTNPIADLVIVLGMVIVLLAVRKFAESIKGNRRRVLTTLLPRNDAPKEEQELTYISLSHTDASSV